MTPSKEETQVHFINGEAKMHDHDSSLRTWLLMASVIAVSVVGVSLVACFLVQGDGNAPNKGEEALPGFLKRLEERGYVSGNEEHLSPDDRRAIAVANRYVDDRGAYVFRYRLQRSANGYEVHVMMMPKDRVIPTHFGVTISRDWATVETYIGS
jgi:hypothetical protein